MLKIKTEEKAQRPVCSEYVFMQAECGPWIHGKKIPVSPQMTQRNGKRAVVRNYDTAFFLAFVKL